MDKQQQIQQASMSGEGTIRGRQGDAVAWLLRMLFFITPLLIYLPSFDSVIIPKLVFITVLTGLLGVILVALPRRFPLTLAGFRTPLDIPLLAVLFTCALSRLVKGNSLTGDDAFSRLLLAGALIYLLVYLFRMRQKYIDLCRRALFLAAVILSGYVIVQDYGLDFLPWQGGVPDWRGQLPGTMGNPNAVAGFLAILLPGFLAEFYQASRLSHRLLCGTGLLIIFMAQVVTFSAGAWIAILFGVLLAGWILRKPFYKPLSWPVWSILIVAFVGLFLLSESSVKSSFMAAPLDLLSHAAAKVLLGVLLLAGVIYTLAAFKRRMNIPLKRVIIPLILLAVAALFYMTPNPLNGRRGSILDQAAASDRWKTGAGARRFIWQTTGIMTTENPVSGIGFGNYFKVHAEYQGQLYRRRGTAHDRPSVGKVPQVHNEYFQHMAETGIPGSFAFFWLVLAIIALWPFAYNNASKERRIFQLAAITGLGIFMVHALTSFPLRRPSAWLAGAFLLAQVVAAADPAPAGQRKKSPRLHPGLLVLLMTAALFQISREIRPLAANIHLQSAMEGPAVSARQLDHLNKAVQWTPAAFEPRFMLAAALANAGQAGPAITQAQTALKAREDLDARLLVANILEHEKKFSASASAWRQVLDLNPCYPPYLREAASRLERIGQKEEAEQYRRLAEKFESE